MDLMYAHERCATPPRHSIFLAGPSPRGNEEYSWRPEAIEILESLGYTGTVYVPLPRDGQYHDDYDDRAQANWELDQLETADVIVFWIPRDLVTLPGFTTNVEFGMFCRKNAVLGFPMGTPKMRYLVNVAERYGVRVFHTLRGTLGEALSMLP